MGDFDVEETMMVSDLSESYGSGDDGSRVGGSSLEPLRGVRNCGVPPFVSKLYNIVCDKDYDSIISWVSIPNVARMGNHVHGATSFAIWNEVEFINKVLPLMSRSNNFDSFISQLNNYGFKKVNWDLREYANKWFLEGKPHLLKNMKNKSSSKRKVPMNEKMSREIKKIESESREIDYELNAFKEYVDNTISNQKKILQVMSKAIKTILDSHKDVYAAQEVEFSDNVTRSLTLTGQHGQEENLVGESSSSAPSCVIVAKD
ncbi:heat stress transcription factor A-2b-like [Rutidosis leptorrhynchoides]|uniref:heat stress transcription factor A-2b-like n=1 Tax=Rutidosis leptorrhynchoides TaxID=125765 RepID=UPI003A999CE2